MNNKINQRLSQMAEKYPGLQGDLVRLREDLDDHSEDRRRQSFVDDDSIMIATEKAVEIQRQVVDKHNESTLEFVRQTLEGTERTIEETMEELRRLFSIGDDNHQALTSETVYIYTKLKSLK